VADFVVVVCSADMPPHRGFRHAWKDSKPAFKYFVESGSPIAKVVELDDYKVCILLPRRYDNMYKEVHLAGY
jgi:hypothetical protein